MEGPREAVTQTCEGRGPIRLVALMLEEGPWRASEKALPGWCCVFEEHGNMIGTTLGVTGSLPFRFSCHCKCDVRCSWDDAQWVAQWVPRDWWACGLTFPSVCHPGGRHTQVSRGLGGEAAEEWPAQRHAPGDHAGLLPPRFFFLRDDQVRSSPEHTMGILALSSTITSALDNLHHHFLSLIQRGQLSVFHHKVMAGPGLGSPSCPPHHQPSDHQCGLTGLGIESQQLQGASVLLPNNRQSLPPPRWQGTWQPNVTPKVAWPQGCKEPPDMWRKDPAAKWMNVIATVCSYRLQT